MSKNLTDGQRQYEARRAAKAGMSLDKWLDTKEKQRLADIQAAEKAANEAAAPKKAGFFSRLIDKAHKPLG